MADFGESRGLAYRIDPSGVIGDYERHDMRMRQNKELAAAKAQLFADSVQYQNAANEFDNKRIKELNDAKVKEIGAFYKENPDALYNPDKLLILNQMKRSLVDNPEVLRGKASDDAFKALNADLQEVAKNPQMYDQEAYQNLLAQKENYLKFGNQLGAEFAKTEGFKPFVYTKPQQFVPDLAKTLQGLGKGINQYEIQKNEDGDWWRTPDPEAVKALKTEAYQAHRRQLEVEAKRAGITNPEAVDKWVENQLVSGFDKEYHVGDPDAKFKKQMAWAQLNEQKRHHAAMETPKGGGGANFSAWDESFKNPKKPAGSGDPAAIKAIVGETPPIILYGKTTGKQVDLTGKDFFPDNRYITTEGQKFLLGYVKLSKEEAEQAGIYKQGALTIDGITNDFSGVASEEKGTDKNGKEYDYIKVKYQLPFDVNDKTLRARYDAAIQPDKTIDLQPTQSNKPVYNTSVASLKKAGYSDAQIQQGINQGIFIIQ